MGPEIGPQIQAEDQAQIRAQIRAQPRWEVRASTGGCPQSPLAVWAYTSLAPMRISQYELRREEHVGCFLLEVGPI